MKHIKTPPYHPQSNGQIEHFVNTFKREIKLKKKGNMEKNIQKYLITYTTTPNFAVIDEKSPAKRFIERKLRTPLNDLRKMYGKKKSIFETEKMEEQFNKKHGAKKIC